MCALVTVVALGLTAFLLVGMSGSPTPGAPQPASVDPRGEASPLESTTTASPPGSTITSNPSVPPTSLVTISAPAATSPDARTVQMLLDRHFSAINGTDYDVWRETVTSGKADQIPGGEFAEAYATTVDSDVVVSGIAASGPDSVDVDIAFVSHQAVESAPPDLPSTCIRWSSTWPVSDLSSGGLIGDAGQGVTTRTAC